jgi:hypothetical protein
MTQIPLDIDRVVREVLEELKRASVTEISILSAPTIAPSTAVTSSEPVAKAPVSTPSDNGQLELSARLVTLAEIDGRLAGIRKVVVNPQAVVTPAVRDALRLRNISLCRKLPAKNTSDTALRLVVVSARSKPDPTPLVNTLKTEGVRVENHSTDCILDATNRLAGELAKGDCLGLLLTQHTAAAMCLTNRLNGVRAVLGSNTSNVDKDVNAVGANLLIVDSRHISMFKLCRMTSEYYRGGIRPCPEVYAKSLM